MNLINKVIDLTCGEISSIVAHQCLDTNSRDYGGLVLPENGFAEPTLTANALEGIYGLYYSEDKTFTDDEISKYVELFLVHLLSSQHDDGTLDLMVTNFHCTPTFAFTVQYLYYTYLLAFDRDDKISKMIVEKLSAYFSKGIPALAYGGFHTPNHRLVISSAIFQLLNLLESNKISASEQDIIAMKKTLTEYIAEGIDMDEYGEYTEKSVGVYNIHCNNSLLIMEECNKNLSNKYFVEGSLLTFVKRNIDLLTKYIEPDGGLFSEKSTRQDSSQKTFPDIYYLNYLIYGYMSEDQKYRGYGLNLLSKNQVQSRCSKEGLCRLIYNKDILNGILPTNFSLKPNGAYFNPNFGLFRKTSETTSITAASDTPFFFKYQKGTNALSLRLSSSWYGEKGQFIPSKIVKRDESNIELSWDSTWGYLRPFTKSPGTSVWDEMDHDSRDKVNVFTMAMIVSIEILDKGCKLEFKMDNICNVPFKLEAIFSPNGLFSSKGLTSQGWADTEIISGDNYSYCLNTTNIEVNGGFANHNKGVGMRGSDPLVPGSFTVTSTGITPYNQTIHIK